MRALASESVGPRTVPVEIGVSPIEMPCGTEFVGARWRTKAERMFFLHTKTARRQSERSTAVTPAADPSMRGRVSGGGSEGGSEGGSKGGGDGGDDNSSMAIAPSLQPGPQ